MRKWKKNNERVKERDEEEMKKREMKRAMDNLRLKDPLLVTSLFGPVTFWTMDYSPWSEKEIWSFFKTSKIFKT